MLSWIRFHVDSGLSDSQFAHTNLTQCVRNLARCWVMRSWLYMHSNQHSMLREDSIATCRVANAPLKRSCLMMGEVEARTGLLCILTTPVPSPLDVLAT
ncbi:unnamed protein product [Protopolystoma xenopodis]|uniref:Uncharacterized protein n=1 Tax=Protopolystoma xenopodis TaxID=117903 RepID=A0A3S5BG55_9PLAT|nr:unnamed protein product [Protopolystoma xenopodis]